MGKRIQRVNELIKRELSQILLREADFPKDVLATITRVETSVNLNQTKVYISAIPEEKAAAVLQILNKRIYDLQQMLNKRLKMRPIPRIGFVEEKETIEAGGIEKILEGLKSKR